MSTSTFALNQFPGRVGPLAAADGVSTQLRLGRDSSVAVQDSHGRYQEAVYRGNVFIAATQAAVTFSVGLTTTTCVGLILSNPPNSGKNLVLLQAEFSNTGVVAGTVGLSVFPYSATAFTHTTALTPINALLGAPAGCVGKADSGSSSTPTTPVLAKALFTCLTTNTAVSGAPVLYDLGGSIIIAPGTAAAILASAAVTGFASMTWEEISTV